ncbi:DMT family transporter [Paenibacillus eucommiae]|uniref:DMT family transporter n=1 Tax=Paenibacillus eucommiae TaxID=1355755 RepID=UPI0035E412A3
MNPLRKAYSAAILYAVIIGFSFIFVKLTLAVSHPVDMLAHRFTISFGIALLLVFAGNNRPRFKLGDILRLLPLAIFYPSLFFAFQAYGLFYISSSEAGIIQATIPILTMIMAAYFLKEHSTLLQISCIFLSVLGVVYIFVMKGAHMSPGDFKGSVFILLSALSSAAYNVIARKMSRKYRAMDITVMMMGIGFVVFNSMSIVRHVSEGSLGQYFEPFADLTFVVSIIYLGVMSSLVTSFLNNYALTYMEASQMGVFINFSTLVTIAAGVVVLKEQLAYFYFIGAIFIIGGVVGTNVLALKKARLLQDLGGSKRE